MGESIIVYGADWCIDCRRAQQFLTRHQIPYTWINIDRDKKAEQYVLKVNRGMRSIPTIVFEDGSVLTEPSNYQLAEKLRINIGV
ncbi:MAG TPA: glutaredoxin domain-containing protein [Anaerolineales bacterium]